MVRGYLSVLIVASAETVAGGGGFVFLMGLWSKVALASFCPASQVEMATWNVIEPGLCLLCRACQTHAERGVSSTNSEETGRDSTNIKLNQKWGYKLRVVEYL